MATHEEVSRLKSLYAGVVHQAIVDARTMKSSQAVKARRWLMSEDDEVLSFRWICETVLGISAFQARRRIAARWN